MWQQSTNKSVGKDVCSEKQSEDSGIVDSGFLSGNIPASSDLSEDITGDIDPPEVREEPQKVAGNSGRVEASMRVDSGVDVGLSESLSQLSLKNVELNRLGVRQRCESVQPEPVLEPIVVKVEETQQRQQEDQHIEPWQLYYIQDSDGDTQLHIAIIQGFLEAAAFSLIKMVPHPCLLDIINDDGQAPLHLAVLTRQPRIVRRLILGGANPSLRDSRGNTALHLACAASDLSAARALTYPLAPIERNYLGSHKKIPALPQNLEQVNYQGETCLHIAAAKDQVDLVRLLLRLGADLEAREGLSGKTALHIAIEHGCHSVVSFLLKECRPCLDAPNYAGLTAYQIAICLDSQLANDLVKLGATPEPLPESDSEGSEDSDEDDVYLPTLSRLGPRIGVRA
ncbi:NF-kappa-B inhibitor cactus [Diachasma alloeum]|uniref:NF-kappa-B inhibitor cactus n=1 Tax=Diachasma alloeum TaxID=454923 RepID=UPI00073832B9|nr:NF-kappa-B inhibitor cactus [Diachasma alloeum]